MKTFKDSEGREWAVRVNYSANERVKAANPGIDLFDLGTFEKIGSNPSLLIKILLAICAPQIEDRKYTEQQFADALVGDSIEAAGDALAEEIINFFPKRRRETLAKMLKTAAEVQQKATELLEQKIESGEAMRELEAMFTPPSGDVPASAAFTPATSPSANST